MINGWFPRIGPHDDVASGNAGITVTPGADLTQAHVVAPVGLGPIWAGPTLVYSLGEAPPGRTQVGPDLVPKAYTDYRGSPDTRWVGVDGAGLDLYANAVLLDHVPGAFAPRLWAVAGVHHAGWITVGDGSGRDRQLVLDDVVQATGAILDFVVPPEGNWAVYQTATFETAYTRALFYGATRCEIRSDEAPIAGFNLAGEPWIVTGTTLPGGVTFVRPVAAPRDPHTGQLLPVLGYAIRGILNYPCAAPSVTRPGQLLVVGSGAVGDLQIVWIDFTQPREDLTQIEVTPPVPDLPIGPVSPPITSGTIDVPTYLTTDPALQPRSGPTHPQHQTQPDAHGTFYLVKFGDIIPEGRAYEMYTRDAGGVRHREDASGATPMHFSDTRWWPKTLQLGEAHAFVTGPHESIWDERDPCRETHRDPVNRKMWAQQVWPDFYWGPDLRHRQTVQLAYDNTAGIHGPGRFVEVGYYAVGGGWCRWESHRSDLVYAHGPAVFDDTTIDRHPDGTPVRSDFYLVGGPATLPELTGCVDPLAITGLPWEAPIPIPPPSLYTLLSELPMSLPETRVGVIGPAGLYGRPDVAANRIHFDQSTPSAETQVEITKPDDNYTIRFIQANKIINFPGTWGADSPTGGFVRQFELRDPDQRGADESPTVRIVDGTGVIIAFVLHEGAWTSAPLTLGPVA